MFNACCKPPTPDRKFSAELLMKLMGDSRLMPMYLPGHEYTKGKERSDDKAELEPPLTRL